MELRHNGLMPLGNTSTAKDIVELYTIAFSFQRPLSMTEYRVKERMKDKRYEAYGYVEDGALVGFFYVFAESIFGPKEIEAFCVSPWKRGNGIASIMLGFILNKYRLYDFHLTVALENVAARGLYKKFGFNATDGINMVREAT